MTMLARSQGLVLMLDSFVQVFGENDYNPKLLFDSK